MQQSKTLRTIGVLLVLVSLISCSDRKGRTSVPDDNIPPTAMAIARPNDTVIETLVELDASFSSDSDGQLVAYLWEQISGTTVTLNNSDLNVANFITPTSEGDVTFRLTVTDDDGATATDTVTVGVSVPPVTVPPNNPPQADAGMDQTVDADSTVMLDGSASFDSDGSIATFAWTQTVGVSVSLTGANTAQPTFTAPSINGNLTFRLTVTDDRGAQGVDTVTVTVENGVVMQPGLDSRPNNTSCIAPASPGQTPGSVELVDYFPALDLSDAQFPLGLYQLPNNNNFFYVITRTGRVFRFANDPAATILTEVLDITALVDTFSGFAPAGEGGLLGFAFHPNINLSTPNNVNNKVYVSYTTGFNNETPQNPRSVIAQYTMTNGVTIDPNSAQVLLTVNQPFGNHNGGDIHFGPDGYLYIAMGDGGSANDPQGHGQNTNTRLGSILRIGVNPSNGTTIIPPDNPFESGGGDGAIYAYGLRNPYRFSFDSLTGTLWAGDVGQSAREEVDQVVNGGNYGWAGMEGNICRIADCSGFIAPVHDYGRTVGTSITGGYVYRGSDIPTLDGAYIFGDFGSDRVWTLTPGPSGLARSEIATAPTGIVSFAQDNSGEVYVLLGYFSAGNQRSILKIQEVGGSTASNIPLLLSDTGCFNPADPTEPDSGLIPFDVISPLWSDGAVKERWMALPNGETVDVDSLGDFDFPVGTILAKHFATATTMIETRLLMLHETGWGGYSYQWRADQSDADLLDGALDQTVDGLDWHYPSRAECRQCHTQVKNFALAPEILQINNDFTYPQTTRTANQVFTLNSIGVFSAPPNPNLNSATMFSLDDLSATLEQRVKSYLHTNCSQCHQPGGTGEGDIDLRFETPLVDMGICNVVPNDTLGIVNARYIAPGNPAASVILERMLALPNPDPLLDIRMPPLATSVVDTEATDRLTDWINELGTTGCP